LGASRACARLTLLLVLCACAQRTARPGEKLTQGGAIHHVRAGETLWRIARTYAVPLELLLRENALEDPTQLPAGAQLFVPGAERELPVPPADTAAASARMTPARRHSPSSIPRAGGRPLDPAARGEALAWPTPGVLISGFGARDGDHHEGIDLAAPENTPVRAADDGVVLFSGEQRGYGKLVLIAHEGDLVTVYAHNATNLVSRGERVFRGEEIARVGRTGNATGPHLHFEVRVGTRPRDPLGFLR
jgi:lipoprotein NlpD